MQEELPRREDRCVSPALVASISAKAHKQLPGHQACAAAIDPNLWFMPVISCAAAGKLCIEVTAASKVAWISEELCIGCGICVKVGPVHRDAADISRQGILCSAAAAPALQPLMGQALSRISACGLVDMLSKVMRS